jgi:hypothetical protein
VILDLASGRGDACREVAGQWLQMHCARERSEAQSGLPMLLSLSYSVRSTAHPAMSGLKHRARTNGKNLPLCLINQAAFHAGVRGSGGITEQLLTTAID